MQRPILHLRRTRRNARPKRYAWAMFYCRGDTKKVLGGGANSPPCNLICVGKITFGHGVMSSGHSTISRPHPALKQYEQRVHTMDQLMVSFQRWTGSADEDINLFLVCGKNYLAATRGS